MMASNSAASFLCRTELRHRKCSKIASLKVGTYMNNVLLRTVDVVGVKRAFVRHDGRDKERVTVILGFDSEGRMLRVMFIFKGKPGKEKSERKLHELRVKYGYRAGTTPTFTKRRRRLE